MAGRFSVETIFRAIDRVTRPVSRMANNSNRNFRAMERGVARFSRSVDSAAQTAQSAAMKIGVALAGTFAASASAMGIGVEFEHELIKAGAKLPGMVHKGTLAYQELGAAIRDVGATTEFTARQAAQGGGFMAMAGFTQQDIVQSLPGLADLSTVADADIARSSDIATDLLGSFNLMKRTGDATKDAVANQKALVYMTDILSKTITSANVNTEHFFETMKLAGPPAVAAQQSVEMLAGAVAVLGNAGIKGSQGGTMLRRVLKGISSPSASGARIMRELGVSVEDATTGGFRPMVDVLEDLRTSLSNLPVVDRVKVIQKIFDVQGQTAVNILLNNIDAWREYENTLQGAAGTTKQLAEVIRSSTQNRLKSMRSVLEDIAIGAFELSEGSLTKLIDRTVQWTRANKDMLSEDLGKFFETLMTNIGPIADGFLAVTKALIGLIALNMGLKTLAATFALLNAAMLLGPAGLAVAAILAGSAGVAAIASGALNPSAVWEELQQTGGSISGFGGAIGEVGGGVGVLLDSLRTLNLQASEKEDRETANREGWSQPSILQGATHSFDQPTDVTEIRIFTDPGITAEPVTPLKRGKLVIKPSGGM